LDIYGYLRAQANELGSRILEMYPPLQSTTDEVPPELSTLLRRPLPAQAIAIGGLESPIEPCDRPRRNWTNWNVSLRP